MPNMPNPAYHPEKKSIGELLAMTNPAIIVPDWQRNYSWRTEHTETFWSDLTKFIDRAADPITTEYFFGSIVLVGGDTGRILLLDGQQRLATSMILLASLRDALQPLDAESAEWIQKNYLSSFDPIKEIQIHKLRLNVYDRDFYQRLISDQRTENYVEPEPLHASHHYIKAAKTYFDATVADHIRELSPADAKRWLKRVMVALTDHFTVIAASSENEDNAAEVFETLNDRGIGLSTPDLLRNLIIRRGAEGQRDAIVERWEDVIAFRSDGDIKAFLRHYWISHYGDVKSQSLYREVKTRVESDDIQSLELSTQLRDSARLYRKLKKADVDHEEVESILESIDTLGTGAAILFPCLLSIHQTLEGDDIVKGVKALMHVFVRDALIGGTENSILENRFHRAARQLREHKDVATFCATINEGALVDDDVRSRFERLSVRHNGQRRYLLYKLEMAKRATEEVEIAPPSRVHVEHIYPQTPQTGQRWQGHDQWVNRIGNLTLLSRRINSGIKNGVFAVKKEHYDKSEILMTKELSGFDGWDSGRVAARQAELAGLVTGIWPLIA
jgi:hypothetical protein